MVRLLPAELPLGGKLPVLTRLGVRDTSTVRAPRKPGDTGLRHAERRHAGDGQYQFIFVFAIQIC